MPTYAEIKAAINAGQEKTSTMCKDSLGGTPASIWQRTLNLAGSVLGVDPIDGGSAALEARTCIGWGMEGAFPLESLSAGKRRFLTNVQMSGPSQGSFILYDRLCDVEVNPAVALSQTLLDTGMWPQRYEDDPSVQVWLENIHDWTDTTKTVTITATDTNGTIVTSPAVGITNVAGQRSYLVPFNSTTGKPYRSVEGCTLSALENSGGLCISMMKPLFCGTCVNNGPTRKDLLRQAAEFPELHTDCFLMFMYLPATATAGRFQFTVSYIDL